MDTDGLAAACAEVLAEAYGLHRRRLCRISAGMSTINYVARRGWDTPLFVKVYPMRTDVRAESEAIAVCQHALRAGVPAPALIPSVDGAAVYDDGSIPLSVWRYMPGRAGDRVPLDRRRLSSVGTVLGRVHRCLATYGDDVSAPGGWCDVDQAEAAIEAMRVQMRSSRHLDDLFQGMRGSTQARGRP
jgi:homoserine kinase type II